MRTNVFIGDVHGCLDALRRLEDKVRLVLDREGREPFFVIVGDLLDRGSQVAPLVAHVREAVAAGTHACLLGNHEAEMLVLIRDRAPGLLADAGVVLPDYLETVGARHRAETGYLGRLTRDQYSTWRLKVWLAQGGGETLFSYDCEPLDASSWRFPPEDLVFLAGLPVLWRDEEVVATHAFATMEEVAVLRAHANGFPVAPMVLRNTVERVLWTRGPPDRPADPDRIHVSGHTPRRRPVRYPSRRCIQIDTGCVGGGRLTAWWPGRDRAIGIKFEGTPWVQPRRLAAG